MAEGMAEVEQCPRSVAVGDIGLDHPRLGGDALPDRLLAILAMTRQQRRAMIFQPLEQGFVPDQAIFDHLGIAGAQLPFAERVEQGDVGDHQARLVEHADQVLLAEGVDRGLAADRAVGLGEQGGG
jgi:hypothetical protein